MMEIVYSLLLIGIGILGLYFSLMSLINPAFAEKYFERSPKAWLGRKILGAERASIINRKVTLPLGIAFGLGLILAGVLLLIL